MPLADCGTRVSEQDAPAFAPGACRRCPRATTWRRPEDGRLRGRPATMTIPNARRTCLLVVVCVSGVMAARAEVSLLDGETEVGIAAWSNVDRVTADEKPFLPLAGAGSARIRVPARESTTKRDEREHARLASPPVTDWRPYERLVMDVFNDSLAATRLRIEVNTAANESQLHVMLPPDRWVRLEWPTVDMDGELADLSQVKDVQIAIDRQARVMKIYVDNVMLLEPGETPPVPAAAFVDEAARSLREDWERVTTSYADRRTAFSDERSGQVAEWAEQDALADSREVGRLLDAPDTPPDVLVGLGDRLSRIEKRLVRVTSIVEFAEACTRAGVSGDQDVLVGVSDSMTTMFPREMPVELTPPTEVSLVVARNETESFQVGVLPLSGDLREVRVECEDLRSVAGGVLSREHVECDVCLLYTSPSPRDLSTSRMPSSA